MSSTEVAVAHGYSCFVLCLLFPLVFSLLCGVDFCVVTDCMHACMHVQVDVCGWKCESRV